jgi:hypothetical protein
MKVQIGTQFCTNMCSHSVFSQLNFYYKPFLVTSQRSLIDASASLILKDIKEQGVERIRGSATTLVLAKADEVCGS